MQRLYYFCSVIILEDMDGTELYIKIALGQPNSRTVCISFHLAEHPIRYAFK